MSDKREIFKKIPSVDELLKISEIEKLAFIYSRNIVVEGIRDYLDELRKRIVALNNDEISDFYIDDTIIIEGIYNKIEARMRFNLRHVVNATGVVIHTNLGRALISPKIKENLWQVASHYSNLEMDIESGIRGSRYSHVEELLTKITGAEAAMVVNNNAAAVMLVLNTIASSREVVVSRGQLVEIGGSFRVPDVMSASGATLREVGTTNKTHLEDYKRAVNDNTAALMKVHTSNYRICGFTKEIESEELVELGRQLNFPIIEDLGSGVLLDLQSFGLPYEPTVQSAIKAGMDVVSFSGDKMLGGPQAGIIVGKKEYIDKMKKNPLTRAFRIDKLTLIALEGTLRLYLDRETALREIPVLKMLTYDKSDLAKRAKRLYTRLKKAIGQSCSLSIENEFSEVGGGSMPLFSMPTKVIAISFDEISIEKIEKMLRDYKVPIITRISKNKLLLDIRTIMDDEFDIIKDAFTWTIDRCNVQTMKAGVRA